MFSASIAKSASDEARKARKMAEIEKRAREKFRKTAIDPERVKKQLEMRKQGAQKGGKKHLKNRLQNAILKDAGAVSPLAIQDKKLRSKKLLYGFTGEEVEFHAGDRVRLGDWPEYHTSHKYNGSVGVVVEKVEDGNVDDVSITDLKTKRTFSQYAVRIPFVKEKSTFTSAIDSSLYQTVEKEITIFVKKGKMQMVKASSAFDTAAKSSWQEQTRGYFDEDDLVDPTAGVNARLRVKQQLAAAKAARATVGGKKVNPDLVLSREQRARIQHQKDVEEWKKKDTDFHESNRTVSTALFLWNETNGAAPEKPAMQQFKSFTVKAGTGLPSLQENGSNGGGAAKSGAALGKGGRKVERRLDASSGYYYTRKEFVDYYGDLTEWSRARGSARFDEL